MVNGTWSKAFSTPTTAVISGSLNCTVGVITSVVYTDFDISSGTQLGSLTVNGYEYDYFTGHYK